MSSVSPTEILAISVVALLVFEPSRLPEITRNAGKGFPRISNTANGLKAGPEAEPKAERGKVIDTIGLVIRR